MGLSASAIRQVFALLSSIGGRFARSGAGTAAYRFCRLVDAPGDSRYSMSMRSMRLLARYSVVCRSFATFLLFSPATALAETTGNTISVNVDQAKLLKLPD